MREINGAIHLIEIYPVDSVINLLNNRDLVCPKCKDLPSESSYTVLGAS